MDMQHLQPYLDAMDAGRVEALGEHLSDDVKLYSPLISDPVTGRENVVKVLNVLHSAIDTFTTDEVIAGERRAAVMLRIRAGDVEVTGVDDVLVGEDGLITSMSVQWRPLENVVAIQNRFAPLLGVPALALVPREG